MKRGMGLTIFCRAVPRPPAQGLKVCPFSPAVGDGKANSLPSPVLQAWAVTMLLLVCF
ncbi:rCG42258 [Rattus norvegicus]|uniref:RCG42258 n=1 Tax=Rattus norvegicus TaxID=10116 RepID=A6KFQ7_RAT|nr:rCG42258 [Rattus norvegicus]